MIKLMPERDGSPQRFPAFDDIVDVAFGNDGRGCVIRSDGWVYCAGALRGDVFDDDPTYTMKRIPNPREFVE